VSTIRSSPMSQPALLSTFGPALKHHELQDLERQAATIIGVQPDFTLAYLNPAYFRFAEENDLGSAIERWGIGANLLDAISEPLRDHYRAALEDSLARHAVWHHDYECSTPDTYRLHHLTAYPLPADGLLLVHSLRVERPHEDPGAPALEERYRGSDGLVFQCSYCRRTRVAADPTRWDRVPALVARPAARTSHGICPVCQPFYFPKDRP
jgi:hypothetical protein